MTSIQLSPVPRPFCSQMLTSADTQNHLQSSDKFPSTTSMSASDAPEADNGAYLTYNPTSCKKPNNYSHYLDRLGFRDADDWNAKRREFVDDCKEHINASDFKFARLSHVPSEFRKMVLDFLRIYGSKHWGRSPRDHLSEPDIMKGFLVPRDTRRKDSRLIYALEDLFDYKAKNMGSTDKLRSLEKQQLTHIDTTTLTWPMQISSNEESDSKINIPAINTSEVGIDIKHSSHKSITAANASDQQAVEDSDTPLVPSRRRLSIDPDYVDNSDSSPPTRTSRKRRVNSSNVLTPVSLSTRLPTMEPPGKGSPETTAKRPRLKKLPAKRAIISERSAIRRSSYVPMPNSSSGLARPEAEDEVIILDHSPFKHQTAVVKGEQGSKRTCNPLNLPANVIDSTLLIVRASNQTHIAPAIVRLRLCRNVHDLFTKLSSKCGIAPDVAKNMSTISATYTWSGKQHRICKGDEDDFNMFCTILRKAWEKAPGRFKDECEVGMLLHVNE